MAEDTKKCSFCSEMIKKGAIKCKHCHSFMEKVETDDKRSDNSAPNPKKTVLWVALTIAIIGSFVFWTALLTPRDGQRDRESGMNNQWDSAAEEVVEKPAVNKATDTNTNDKTMLSATTVTEVIDQTIGPSTNRSDYVEKLYDYNFDEGGLNIYLIGNDGLSKDRIKSNMLKESAAIYSVIFDVFQEAEFVALTWKLPLVDTMGNEDLYHVIMVDLDEETAAMINWDNFLHDNLPSVADIYWEHQYLSN